MAKPKDRFNILAEGLVSSGIDLLDEGMDSKYINDFARGLSENSEDAVKMLFRYVLAYRLMGVSRDEMKKPALTEEQLTRFHFREPFISLIPKILEKGVTAEDLSQIIRASERWGGYLSLFNIFEILEAFDYQLDMLLSKLKLEKIDDAEIFNSRIGLAQFDADGNFIKEISVTHEEIGPDAFFAHEYY
jgi:hypothetical protein